MTIIFLLLSPSRCTVEPMKPENFMCVSRNWEELTCSWDPVPNDVATNYTLRFHFTGRAGGHAVHTCPQPKYDQPPNTCVLGPTTDPIYRQPKPYYNFTLDVSNHFGKKSFSYLFNHYAHGKFLLDSNMDRLGASFYEYCVNGMMGTEHFHFSHPVSARGSDSCQQNFFECFTVLDNTVAVRELSTRPALQDFLSVSA